jgi:hypothetical protein
VVDEAEVPEGSQQRVLDQILAIPDVSGEPATVAVERRPQRHQHVDIAMPGRAQFVAQRVRSVQLGHVEPSLGGSRSSHTYMTDEAPPRIRRMLEDKKVH